MIGFHGLLELLLDWLPLARRSDAPACIALVHEPVANVSIAHASVATVVVSHAPLSNVTIGVECDE